ncbi:MAG: hypothetical protein Q8M76_05420, partial [Spirochaetaceae bacterium]|nr:hypothetical protein [Spirochaetaceae bacterium]
APQAAAQAAAKAADWAASFEATFSSSVTEGEAPVSKLAQRLARAAGAGSWESLDSREAARIAYRAALEAERALRFGSSPQEAMARIAQGIKLTGKSGDEGIFTKALKKLEKSASIAKAKKSVAKKEAAGLRRDAKAKEKEKEKEKEKIKDKEKDKVDQGDLAD